ncbi:MAG: MBOAT family protein, partial [Methylococcales bacterium]|nr:MBOAT family protein [Methylococcales bacterium]
NSYAFIFGFLPVVFLGFFGIGRYSHYLASLWLAAASLFFYGWWDARYVGLLMGSIALNYGAGYLIGHQLKSSHKPQALLICAIVANLLLLGYFKYANFFVQNINDLVGTTLFSTLEIILPLGISFFTFTQIAFLVDTYQGKVKEFNFVHYTLFVTYFPHLIAGPVLHHKEMMPQFASRNTCNINGYNVACGLTIFVLGLGKKVLVADTMADYASPVFNFVASGGQAMLFEAWVGALAYTLQLYFDFSAYSDMAIGLSLMFNVRLPMNFNSPYKATSIIEFWRCWHMTLSRFLRDYLYIPLGGSHNGTGQRYLNLMITMLLGGLWHGAGWTFIIWGGLHGVYLIINHSWRKLKEVSGWGDGGTCARIAAGALTFIAVVVGWVFFRADCFGSAITLLKGMVGLNGLSLPSWFANYPNYIPFYDAIIFIQVLPSTKLSPDLAMLIILFGLMMVWWGRNVEFIANSIMERHRRIYVAFILGGIFGVSLIFMRRVSEFLYFQF